MDETDCYLLKKLTENPRLTYRQLADMNNISVSAIHKRIKSLEDGEIINNYTTRPSLVAFKYLLVVVFGTSNANIIYNIRGFV